MSPFFRAIFDAFCEDFEKAEVTKVLTDYVELVRLIIRRNNLPAARPESELSELCSRIANFETSTRSVFGQYQACSMELNNDIFTTSSLIV